MRNGKTPFMDRDLSWLDFNIRVLELAEDQKLPLLERLKFLGIFSSNLDEYFMVRVASLQRKIELGTDGHLIAGFTAHELLSEIQNRVRELNTRVQFLINQDLRPRLVQEGIKRVSWDSLSETEKSQLSAKFETEILPILTPLASDPSHPFPHISGLSLNLGISVKDSYSQEARFVRVKVPSNVPRVVKINEDDYSYILQEDLIAEHLDLLLPGADIEDFYLFRVTRNEDLDLEEETDDLLSSLEEELSRRKFGAPVRLEVEEGISKKVLKTLIEELEITDSQVFIQAPPLDLTFAFEVYTFDRPDLKSDPFSSIKPHMLADIDREDCNGFFSRIRDHEIFLHHPYESFTSSVVRFVEHAARDPKVLSIKQTLYRTSGDSPIMHSLIEAARAGKQVLAVIELRARFDEQANVRWAKRLEDAGVHVVYGMLGLKTHAKASLVVRRDDDGIYLYSHVGTGNYNPKTARLYDDLGLISADQILGRDLMRLFNQLSGALLESKFQRLVVAPRYLRDFLVENIRVEVSNHLNGKPSRIRWKVNSLLDDKIINELYKASDAGVPIEIVVRGMCAFRMSRVAKNQNVKIISILGRFLEHSRIMSFYAAGSPVYFIGSADIMERNLDRRIETLVKILEPGHIAEIEHIFEESLSGQCSYWLLNSEDLWERHTSVNSEPLLDFQERTIARFKK